MPLIKRFSQYCVEAFKRFDHSVLVLALMLCSIGGLQLYFSSYFSDEILRIKDIISNQDIGNSEVNKLKKDLLTGENKIGPDIKKDRLWSKFNRLIKIDQANILANKSVYSELDDFKDLIDILLEISLSLMFLALLYLIVVAARTSKEMNKILDHVSDLEINAVPEGPMANDGYLELAKAAVQKAASLQQDLSDFEKKFGFLVNSTPEKTAPAQSIDEPPVQIPIRSPRIAPSVKVPLKVAITLPLQGGNIEFFTMANFSKTGMLFKDDKSRVAPVFVMNQKIQGTITGKPSEKPISFEGQIIRIDNKDSFHFYALNFSKAPW
ncbi:MAG: PilZ domain-containing protein [Pseudomonadota bacterium]